MNLFSPISILSRFVILRFGSVNLGIEVETISERITVHPEILHRVTPKNTEILGEPDDVIY